MGLGGSSYQNSDRSNGYPRGHRRNVGSFRLLAHDCDGLPPLPDDAASVIRRHRKDLSR